MKELFLKIKNKLGANGSPLLAMLLFVAAFGITVFSLGSCEIQEIDRFAVGQKVREIIDGERGEVVVTINDAEYYEQDLQLMIETLKLSEPGMATLEEVYVRQMAGEALIKQKMLLLEFDRLGLEMTEAEFAEYLADQRAETDEVIIKDDASAKDVMDYISGYGCTYSEYWEDDYVITSFRDNLKLDKLNEHLETSENSAVTALFLEKYLTGLITDETYKVTLFGEEFK